MRLPHIVVINDDPEFLDLIQDLLTDTRNFHVQVIQQGMGAVERLRAIDPDIVILDVRMEYSRLGYHILQTLRRDRQFRDVSVILCTADRQFLEDHKEELEELSCDWLEKPFELDDLLTRIDRAVEQFSARNVTDWH